MTGLLLGRTLRGGVIFALVSGLAAVLLAERVFIQLVHWGDPFFWEGMLRLLGLAAIPILLAAWLANRFRRKSTFGE